MACQDSQWMMEQLWEHFEFYKQIFFYNKFRESAFSYIVTFTTIIIL